ncbi:hypothetical protein EYF80_030860 [Liparis tanakae]|uniref:Uncharacterized protein n=1 Tax=Liparis tanakae TaxID=230148 RepID=A0A4Z2GZ92_9TELE|nr:hypothetical protein EYF80_030860 [Liparis tanakae]
MSSIREQPEKKKKRETGGREEEARNINSTHTHLISRLHGVPPRQHAAAAAGCHSLASHAHIPVNPRSSGRHRSERSAVEHARLPTAGTREETLLGGKK